MYSSSFRSPSSMRLSSLRNLTRKRASLPELPQAIPSGSLGFREIGQLRRFLAFVEELVERDLKCAGHFLQRLDRGNCMAALNGGDASLSGSKRHQPPILSQLRAASVCEG